MCRLRLFLLLIALKVSCHAQNVEVFCPPNDAVLSYDYQNDFITVRTAHNKFIRSEINSYEEYSEKHVYLDLNRKLKDWETFYNYHRPHGAHEGKTPYEKLKSSILND